MRRPVRLLIIALSYILHAGPASAQFNTGEIGGSVFNPDSPFPCYRFDPGSALTMPVLVMVGAHDRAVGVAPQRALARALPHGTLAVFDDSAHFPYAEEPAAFDERLLRFLRDGR